MKHIKSLLAVLAALFVSASIFAQTPKYVFYFIGDGMGYNQVYLTHLYNGLTGQEDVNFYNFPQFRLITTMSASSLVTDSAAAGTALATGGKTDNGRLGTDPSDGTLYSIAHYAKAKGYAVGVVTSVGINHATPASFYSHVASRNQYDDISAQLIERDLDFAAGATFLIKDKEKYTPQCWVDKAREAGITVYQGKGAYKPVSGRVIYLSDDLGEGALPYAIDRKEGETELADFTSAAVEHLSAASKKGFFLMVEGGKIDYACHADDAATAVHEVNDMAKSVDIALEFAAKHPKETLIIVTADHETGGLTMGYGSYELYPEMLQYQKCSKDELTAALYDLTKCDEIVGWGAVKNVLREKLGFWDKVEVSKRFEKELTHLYKVTYLDMDSEEEKNLYSSNAKIASAAIEYLDANKAKASWSFGSHSGMPVPLFVYGASAAQFTSCRDNTEVATTILKVAKYK